MELTKAKYKQTEVGILPVNWEVKPLEYYFDFISYGFTNPMPTANNGIFMVTARDVNYGEILYDSARLTPEWAYYKYLTKKSKPIKNDILLTKDGTLGRLAIVGDKKICINQSVAVIRPNSKVYPLFLKKLLESNYYQRVMLENAGGSTIKHIYVSIVNKMLIGVPPTITEQKAIATALSDVDDLIANLDKLITKKKAIKQGAMQQLLTPPNKGGKRLAGFTGEWVEKKLGDCLKYEQPTKYIVENSDYEGQSQTPVLTAGKSFLLGYTDEDFGVFNHYPVIIFDDFTTSNQFVNFSFKVKSSAMKMLQPVSEEIDIKFMFSIMNQIRFSLGDDHKRRWIAEYSKIEVFVPEKDEQLAISKILSDMEDEINELESKRAKYQDIKQGMMQELLTGKTRLV